MPYKRISTSELDINFPELLSTEYSLVGAKADGKANALAAAWAQIGYLWNRPVATVYIRPGRYTREFIDNSGIFVISFIHDHEDEVWYMGKHSGRDEDKAANAGLHPIEIDGIPTFEEAHTVISCKVIYKQQISPSFIKNQQIIDAHYQTKDLSFQYIGEIENIFIKE